MNTRKISIILVVCCLVAGACVIASLTPPVGLSAGPAIDCPKDEPSTQYVDRVVKWVAQRDGLSPSTNLPTPLVSPLPLPGALTFASPLATPNPIPSSNVGNYLVSDSHYLYLADLQKCYVAVAIVSQHTGRIDKLMLDTTSLAVHDASEIDSLRASRRDPVQSKIESALKNRLGTMEPSDTVRVAVWF